MSAGARFEEARSLATKGNAAGALAVLDALLDEEPDHLAALLFKAQLLLESRASDAALALYERAARTAPRSAEAWNELARCLHALGRHEEGLAAAEQARGLLGEGENARHAASVYLTLVWCLRELRRYKEALAAAAEGLARMPDAVLAEYATLVEQEWAHAERERC